MRTSEVSWQSSTAACKICFAKLGWTGGWLQTSVIFGVFLVGKNLTVGKLGLKSNGEVHKRELAPSLSCAGSVG